MAQLKKNHTIVYKLKKPGLIVRKPQNTTTLPY